jgi:hypothetical protein
LQITKVLSSLLTPEAQRLIIDTGRTRFERLFLIGKCSTVLSLDALRLAVAEAKSGKDVERYEQAVEALKQAAPHDPDAVLDQRWVDVTKQTVRAETDKLEHELKGYKNNLIKESIRVSLPRTMDRKDGTDLYRWEPMI